MTEPLMTEDDLAEFLKVKKQTLVNWRSRGEGPPYVKVGRFPRYERSAVDAWIKQQTVGAA